MMTEHLNMRHCEADGRLEAFLVTELSGFTRYSCGTWSDQDLNDYPLASLSSNKVNVVGQKTLLS
jgi:hypothetical protein